MKILPRKALEFWFCEECKQSREMLSPKFGMKEDAPKASTSNSFVTVHHGTTIGSRGISKKRSGRFFLNEKRPRKGKTKYMTCEEATKLGSGSRIINSPSKSSLQFGPGSSRTMLPTRERTPIKHKAISPKITVKANPTFGFSGQSKRHRPGYAQINPMVQHPLVLSSTELKENNAVLPVRNEGNHIGQSKDDLKCPEEVEITSANLEMEMDGNVETNVELGSLDADNAKLRQYIPALHAYWKGSFKLLNDHLELNDGFKAHPPSRVLRKVFDFTKKMPEVLEFELVPRYRVWRDLFADYCPNKDDVGLYFFPNDSKSSEKYLSFLDFIWTEKLVMKSDVNGVELLVFTSRLLHPDSQKWQGNYFMWGVFHRVRMDNAPRRNNDIPPGFELACGPSR